MDEKFWEKFVVCKKMVNLKNYQRDKKLPEDKLDMKLINVLSRAYINLEDFENALNTNLSFIGKAKEDVTNADIWLFQNVAGYVMKLEILNKV